MKKNKFILCCLLVAAALTGTGCGISSDITINKDQTVTETSSIYLNKSEYTSMASGDNKYTKEIIDGTTFYRSQEEKTMKSWEEWNQDGHMITEDTAVFTLSLDKTIPIKYDFIDITVHVPFTVKETNAKKIDDHTVRITTTDKNPIYISENSSIKKGTDVSMYDAVTGKEIKNGTIFSTKDLIVGEEKLNIRKVKLISRHGLIKNAVLLHKKEETEFAPYAGVYVANGITEVSITPEQTITNASDGKYTIKATLINNTVKKCTYFVDTKKPKIEIKENRIHATDPRKNGYASGIKTIKINGKQVKNDSRVKTGDKIVVTDHAGNKTKATVS